MRSSCFSVIKTHNHRIVWLNIQMFCLAQEMPYIVQINVHTDGSSEILVVSLSDSPSHTRATLNFKPKHALHAVSSVSVLFTCRHSQIIFTPSLPIMSFPNFWALEANTSIYSLPYTPYFPDSVSLQDFATRKFLFLTPTYVHSETQATQTENQSP